MLALPTTGFGRSVVKDNVELDVLCDWIEGSVLFEDERLTQRKVVNVLCSQNIYDDQDMAANRVTSAWSELRRRQRFIGDGSPYKFEGQGMELTIDIWKNAPGHAFCVLLSLAKWYRDWAKQFGKDYTIQGELFEQLTRESVEAQFYGWAVRPTGWSRSNTKKLDAVVTEVAALLGEPKGDVGKWSKVSANEAGLDLVCLRSFPDDRPGRPVFFFQCASGGDWDGKLHTPRLEQWRKLVEFTALGLPTKAFATPFAFLDAEFIRNCMLVDGLLMDRYRLLAVSKINPAWVSHKLTNQIFKWAKPRVAKLARLDE
jgi:hypothetical protein